MKKVTIIYGSNRKGSTYHVVEHVKTELLKYEAYEFSAFHMPKHLKSFCRGCFNCILKSEEKCPDYEEISIILNEMIHSDGIILASPVYGLDVSGPMKNFIDHLCYLWIPHRPNENFFDQIGLVCSTAAGAGMKRTNGTMKKALTFMGVKRTYQLGFGVQASAYEDVNAKIKTKIEKQSKKTAKKFHHALTKRYQIKPSLFFRIFFFMMSKLIKGYQEDVLDRKYWIEKGWIKG